MDPVAVHRLKAELHRWRRQGVTPRLWWRDDDAREPTPALGRLIDIADDRPLTLAIIPARDLAPLAARLSLASGLCFAQHGVDHVNWRPAGQPPSEYVEGTDVEAIRDAILGGRQAMTEVGLAPVAYAPAWGHLDARLLEALPRAGYQTVLWSGSDAPPAGLRQIGAQLDILRWRRPPPRFRGWGAICDSLIRQLRARRLAQAWDEPIGLLTHHLAHDEAAWRFLIWFVAFADRAFKWCALDDLVASTPAWSVSAADGDEAFGDLDIPRMDDLRLAG